MPSIFVGHGSPMNAIDDNEFSRTWMELGSSIGRPEAILSISAHWYVPSLQVTYGERPRIIHDFYGFPKALSEVIYPAPGSLTFSKKVKELLAKEGASLDMSWGLDHGTWSVLRRMFPDANIPVAQLSIDLTKPPAWHLELGAKIRPLRDEGVLILGSGNVVHNLQMADWHNPGGFDWAVKFDQAVRAAIDEGRYADLARPEKMGDEYRMAVPTNEHYLPMFYALGASKPGERLQFFNEKVVMGSISMRGFRLG